MSLALLAHQAPGFQAIGFSPGLLLYLTVTVLVVATLAFRVGWGEARFGPAAAAAPDDTAWPGDAMGPGPRTVLRAVGLAGLVFVLVCGWAGSDQVAVNPTTISVFWGFWLGGQAASVLLGDWWRAMDPFDTLAAFVDRSPAAEPADDGADGDRDWWVPAALLASFAWVWLAWIDGIDPRSAAGWITLYTAVMVIGAVRGGRAWVRRNEAFGVAFGLMAAASPIDWSGLRPRLRNPLRGLAERVVSRRDLAVLVVVIGTFLFDAVGSSQWWADLVGNRSVTVSSVWNTVGLAWLVLLAGVAWIGAARLAERLAGDHGHEVPAELALAAPLALLAACCAVAHEVSSLLVNGQYLVALLSDPLYQGWNLLGTGRYQADPLLLAAGTQAWMSLVLVELGLLGLFVALYDRSAARYGASGAARAAWAVLAFAVVAAVAALKVLLRV